MPFERERTRKALRGLGYHAEKLAAYAPGGRAGVRDPLFRAMPPKVQEEWAGTSFETLRTIYDDVTPDDMRRALVEARMNRR